MRNRIYNFLGYGLGFRLLNRKDGQPPRLTPAGPIQHPPGNWQRRPGPGDATPPPLPVRPQPPQSGKPLDLVTATWNGFNDDDCMTLGAAIAYYSVFSVAPLLMTIIAIAGLVFGRDAIQNQIAGEIQGLVGAEAAQQLQSMLAHEARNKSSGIIATVVGLLTLLFGATGAFAALQDALNKAWHVQPDPAQGGIRNFLSKRVWSFGMILGVVFLLIVSLVVSAVLTAVTTWMSGYLPSGFSAGLAHGVTFGLSFAIISAMFALIFKVLPDGRVNWRDAWVGGMLTSILFTIGKTALALYLGKAAPGSAYGAAGSLVVIVLWMYYASLIVLLGAEFTRAWAAAHGRGIEPDKGAVEVIVERRPAPRRRRR
jgi:membrane protein